jgi:hypothetical protein
VDPVPGQQRVTHSSAVTSEDKLVTAACPAGTTVHDVSGSITGAVGEAYLDAMVPNATGAVVNAREDSTGFSGSWTLAAYAICAA